MVFTSVAIIDIIASPANNLLGILPQIASILASFSRIQIFLMIPTREDKRKFIEETFSASDHGPESTPTEQTDKTVVRLDNASIRPTSTADLVLKEISTFWKRGDLVVISGSVGTGKTSLAKSLLGELSQESGSIQTAYKTVAYCSQVAWLLNGTVKEVICGPPGDHLIFDKFWYKRIVHACDLEEEDLARMPKGDQTVVGSRGITLSGGQKQRVVRANLLCNEIF